MNASVHNLFKVNLDNEAATINLGRELALAIAKSGVCIYLEGDLGAGKTTLSRGLMAGFGHSSAVKSPTYTLVEPYELAEKTIYHFDLYRLAEAQELEFLGIEDYLANDEAVLLFEWSNKGGNFIPAADLKIFLEDYPADYSKRVMSMAAYSPKGNKIFARFKQQWEAIIGA